MFRTLIQWAWRAYTGMSGGGPLVAEINYKKGFEIHAFFLTVRFSHTFSYINRFKFLTVVDNTKISTDLKSIL